MMMAFEQISLDLLVDIFLCKNTFNKKRKLVKIISFKKLPKH
ncbi:hypothetical protein CCAND95_170013 [Capnocytophaga canis]|nr:hypothetical protein CCAND95_170013 [Capnocytophaga canis]